MGKDKLRKFEELKSFNNNIELHFEDLYGKPHPIRGNWAKEIFHNNNPIVLELGCGKGEYVLELARQYPNINFIGIDIKGARIWRGAKTATEEKLLNVFFVRTRIHFIESLFVQGEISEIWVTFPDPQPNKVKARLTSSRFLNLYRSVLTENGIVHLKTDSAELYKYTSALAKSNQLAILKQTDNIDPVFPPDILAVQTHYEKLFRAKGKSINYISFRLPIHIDLHEPIGQQ